MPITLRSILFLFDFRDHNRTRLVEIQLFLEAQPDPHRLADVERCNYNVILRSRTLISNILGDKMSTAVGLRNVTTFRTRLNF